MKKYIFVVIAMTALTMSLNITPISPIITAIAGVEHSGSTRTVPCAKHDWKYVTASMDGKVLYYNYQCQNCLALKYSPWIKK